MSSRLDYQMPINANMHESDSNPERGSISHSLSPLSHRSNNGMYQPQLPALQDPRYSAPSSYDHSSAPPSATSVYSPYSSYPQATYQNTAPQYSNNPSLADSYNMNADPSRPRIPSIHSPVTHHQANPVSPSTSSIRTAYASATPHTARHQHRGSRDLQSPHSPMASVSNLRSPTNPGSPPMRSPADSSLGASAQAGPPMGPTESLCQLSAADGAPLTPEIIGRVEKGFFLSDSDWTCYRRNYFTVVCSFTLSPHVHALPVLLRRSDQSPTESVTCFAMSISAVVDNPSGKAVELVQHTPKRDKGPQLKPGKLKLAASQPTGKGFAQAQQNIGPHGGDFGAFAQQPQQQQFVGSFERIQFKSATANNGKRRAAQQYYHLIIELYADVSNPAVPNSEGEWVKVARKVSAPMVVRGRSPGHYADGGRLQSPGGNSGSGSGSNNPQSPNSNGNPGMMGGGDMGNSHSMMGPGPNGLNMGGTMNGYHNAHMASNYTSPSPSSIRDPSIATPPPLSHMEPPIDPVINGDDSGAIPQDYNGYQYFHEPIYQGDDHHIHHPHGVSMYEDTYPEERKSEGPIVTNCVRFDEEISAYSPAAAQIPKEHPYYRKYREQDGSRGYYPDLPTV